MIKDKTTLIWDWNGTLLNDIDVCVEVVNIILSKYNLNLISKELYREVFTFPVQNSYQKLGIDFSQFSFRDITKNFIVEFTSRLPNCELYPNVTEILQYFHKKKYRQFILSALEHNILVKSIEEKGIANYFESIKGLNNILAASKIKIAQDIIKEKEIDLKKTWIIGDTIHDYEVANELGCNHILIANGHQTYERLKSVTKSIIKNLNEINTIFDI